MRQSCLCAAKTKSILIVLLLALTKSLFAAQQVGSEKVFVRDFALTSESSGFVLTDIGLLRTSDDGTSWTDITPAGVSPYRIAAFHFTNDRAGFVVARSNSVDVFQIGVVVTGDAGTSWSSSPLPVTAEEAEELTGRAWIASADPGRAWVLLKRISSSAFSFGSLYTTEDGGLSWQRLPDPPAAGELWFLNSQDGWLIGGASGRTIWSSHDGGRSWKIAFSEQGPIAAFDAADGAHAWIVVVKGEDGVRSAELWQTTDAGATWTQVSTGVNLLGRQAGIAFREHWPVFVMPAEHYGARLQSSEVTVPAPANAIVSQARFSSARRGWLIERSGDCRSFKTDCHQDTTLLATSDGNTFRDITPLRESLQGARRPIASDTVGAANTTRVNQGGFDKYDVPSSMSCMQTWITASPYRVVGVYIGGENHPAVSVTSNWVSQATAMGWGVIPIWVGPQPPGVNSGDLPLDTTQARNMGVSEADKAVAAAQAYGLTSTVVYYDFESPSSTTTSIRLAMQAFVDGWTAELHNNSFNAGVYSHPSSALDWSSAPPIGSIANRPDAVWLVQYPCSYVYSTCPPPPPDPNLQTIWNLDSLPNSEWSNHQRLRQYTDTHYFETWDGCNMGATSFSNGIDSDWIDGVVAGPYAQPSGTFLAGDSVQSTTGGLNVRAYPADANVVASEPLNATGTILDGPSNGVLNGTMYIWWKVQWADSSVGWSAENYLQKSSGGLNTGTIQISATLDGNPWSGSMAYHVTGALQLDGTVVPKTYTMPPGGYTPYYDSGGPAGGGAPAIDPPASQNLTAGGTIGWTYRFSSSGVCTASSIATASVTITAACTQCYTLIAGVSPAGSGTASVGTPTNCTGGYTSGTSATISASANAGYQFSSWSSSNCTLANAYSAATTCTLNGTGNATVTAYFSPVSTNGVINVYATSDGTSWSGLVSLSLSGPSPQSITSVPNGFISQPGTYTLSYISGGPAGATATILPAATQDLAQGGTTNFTVSFTTSSGGAQTLVAGLSNPVGLAIDGSNLYWSEGPSGAGAIREVAKAGGPATTLVNGLTQPTGVAIDSAYVYFGDAAGGGATVNRVPKSGGSVSVLASGQPSVWRLAVDGSTVYWTDGGQGSIRKVPLNGGSVTVLATDSNSPAGIAVDGSSIYWSEDVFPGLVMTAPLTGGTSSVVGGASNNFGLAIDASNVYWTDAAYVNSGSVKKKAKTGGDTTILASGLDRPWGLAIDTNNAYWIENNPNTSVKQVSLSGGTTAVLATGANYPVAVVTDGSFIYWLERADGSNGAGTLKRAPVAPTPPPQPPTSVVATATSTTTVNISWVASVGAAGYHVYRSSDRVSYTYVGTTPLSTFDDTAAAPSTAYLYKVRAFTSSESDDSNVDLATTVIFTDSNLVSSVTPVKAIHFSEALSAVNAVRALAGLAPTQYTSPAPAAGVTVLAQHLIDLRAGLKEARATLGLTEILYSEPNITAGATTIKATHPQEIRDGVR